MDRDELQRLMAHATMSAKDIITRSKEAKRELTADEEQAIADYHKQADGYQTQIDAIDRRVKLEEETDKREAALAKPKPSVTPGITTHNEAEVRVWESAPVYGGLKYFKSREDAYKTGMWARAMFYNDPTARSYVNHNMPEVRAQSEGINTAGGALVPSALWQAIIQLREEYGVFRRNARVIPMGTDLMTVPRSIGNVTAYWTGEGVAITESSKTFDGVELAAKKLGALCLMSKEVASDAVIDLAMLLANDFAWAFAYKEDAAGFLGDGSATYGHVHGLVPKIKAATASCFVCATATHDVLTEVDSADLGGLMGKLPAYAKVRPSCKWYVSSVADEAVFGRLLIAGGGNNIPSLENGRVTRRFMGYPIEVAQVLPAGLTTDYSNEVMLLFGCLDLAATIGDRAGMTVEQSSEYKFAEDQLALKATARAAISVHDVGDTSTTGPIVALVGGAS